MDKLCSTCEHWLESELANGYAGECQHPDLLKQDRHETFATETCDGWEAKSV